MKNLQMWIKFQTKCNTLESTSMSFGWLVSSERCWFSLNWDFASFPPFVNDILSNFISADHNGTGRSHLCYSWADPYNTIFFRLNTSSNCEQILGNSNALSDYKYKNMIFSGDYENLRTYQHINQAILCFCINFLGETM